MQTKTSSMVESLLNVGSGFIISLLVWSWVIVPVYNLDVDTNQNLEITFIFTVVSVIRGYFWRRYFNRLVNNAKNR